MATGYEIYGYRGTAWQFLGAVPGERPEAEREAHKFLTLPDVQGVRLVAEVLDQDGTFVARVVYRKDKASGLPPFRITERKAMGDVRPRRASGTPRPAPERPAPEKPKAKAPEPPPPPPPPKPAEDKAARPAVPQPPKGEGGRNFSLFPGFGGFLSDLFSSFVGALQTNEDGKRPGEGQPPGQQVAGLVEPQIEDEDFQVDQSRKEVVRQDTETLLRYLYSNLRFVRVKTDFAEGGKLSPTDVFACYLFFAGAAEEQARRAGRPPNEFRRTIAMSLRSIAKSDEEAKRFALHYEEYLADPKQAKIFAQGREGYLAWAKGSGSFEGLANALIEWRQVAVEAPASADGAAGGERKELITVMFTDIVGSTEHSATYGDELHMQLIASHDRIVRAALGSFHGTEIKHLGDGIMASFASVADAVRAGLRVQTEVAEMLVPDPRLQLTIRIGINAGTPIRMGADLFGSTVQLAARLCSACPPGAVAASESVVQRFPDGASLFRTIGAKTLKGFPEPVPVFAVTPARPS